MVRINMGRSQRGPIYHKVREDEESGKGSSSSKNQRYMVNNSNEVPEDDLDDPSTTRLALMAESHKRNKRLPKILHTSHNRMKQKHRKNKLYDKNRSQKQSLTSPVEGQYSKDEQYYFSSRKKTEPSFDPHEQVTDAEYGISHSSDPDIYLDDGNLEEDAMKMDKDVYEDIVGTSLIVLLLIGVITIIAIHATNSTEMSLPISLETICSLEHISTNSGHKECSDACSTQKCCFGSESDDCHKESEDECNLNKYAFCANLQIKKDDEDGDIADITVVERDQVNSACTVNNIQKIQGREECEDACQPRSCCFTSIQQDNCMSDNFVSVFLVMSLTAYLIIIE